MATTSPPSESVHDHLEVGVPATRTLTEQETLADDHPEPLGATSDLEKADPKVKAAPGAKWKEGEVLSIPHKCASSRYFLFVSFELTVAQK